MGVGDARLSNMCSSSMSWSSVLTKGAGLGDEDGDSYGEEENRRSGFANKQGRSTLISYRCKNK